MNLEPLLNLTLPSYEELLKVTCQHENATYHASIDAGYCYDCKQELTWDELNNPFKETK
jgi:hypothetical protein